jgi:hypothetical protein
MLPAGTRVSTYLWARGPNNDVVQMQYMLLNSANMPAASYQVDAYADMRVTLINTYQHFTMVRWHNGCSAVCFSSQGSL